MQEEGKRNYLWIAVACVLALGLILSSVVLSNGLVRIKTAGNTITVTGSAKQQIKSDLAVWNGMYFGQGATLGEAYNHLKDSQDKVKAYLLSKGVAEGNMTFSSINTEIRYVLLPTGQYSNQIDSYRLSQQVELRSDNVDSITVLSREATDLINQGVEFQSQPPQYFYTKIADLKIEMLALATQDATRRAEQISENAKSKVGSLRAARMGVFQITPLYSNEISDYGINDTSSVEKEITAVINCDFEISR